MDKKEIKQSILISRIVIIVGILGAAVLLNFILRKTGPKTTKERPPRPTPLVKLIQPARTTETIVQHVMGTVVAAQQLEIKPQVSGKIDSISKEFIPGGVFSKGSIILEIERTDYEIAVTQAESQLAEAEYLLTTEIGHQEVAKREWELLGDESKASELDKELALRKPHLKRAQAALQAAKAKLKRAHTDLERTYVRAPFNAVIQTKNVDIGTQVSPQTTLAVLTGTDEYWIQASIPVDKLPWLNIPATSDAKGSKAVVYTDKENQPAVGHIIKLLGDLEPQGRMARVLISIKNPPRETLLIGSFVNIEIIGKEAENIIKIPRSALRENAKIWVFTKESELDIRDAEILWRNDKFVLIKNTFSEKEMLIISDLPIPAQGMKLTAGIRRPPMPKESKDNE